MRFLRIRRLLLLALFVVSASCTADATGAAPTDSEQFDDNDILEAVEGDFQFDDAVPEHQIDVQLREGIVTLSGHSDTLLGKRRAQQLVEALKGVRAVVNQIRVRPGDRPDNEILGEVRAALRDDPVADLEQLRVSVVDGVVTLHGEANSFAERFLTEAAVAAVRGVLEIENQITIHPQRERPDQEIKPEIERRLANSPYLAAGLIQVEVQDGQVTLSGTVGSVHEKSIAHYSAWVAGVRRVDASGLETEWWLDRQSRRDSSPPVRNDIQIRRAVEDAFLYDPRLRGADITVHVRQGAVSLLGSVTTMSGKRAAEQDAKDTLGVRRVINHLKVESVEWPGDAAVTRHVNEALARDAVLTRFKLQASSHFGKVYLRGDVNHPFERHRAAVVVGNVPGVLSVINRIAVDAAWEPKPDEDIREDTVRRMRWSPLLDFEQIHVAVTDGVVTLTGTVHAYHQRAAAARHARQGGARRVVNQLQVRAERTAPVGLKATLIPKRAVYILKAEHSGEAFRRFLRTAERNRQYDRLPPAPAVDLIFRLQNQGDRPVDVRIGHDNGGFEMILAGAGATHVRLKRAFPSDFQMGAVVTIRPGSVYEIPIQSLQYGFRGGTDRWYWTQPGQYRLDATFTWPADRSGLFGECAVTADPVDLTVKGE